MDDLNKLFDSFPDYDVFDDKNSNIGKKEKIYGDDDFIEYKPPTTKAEPIRNFIPNETEEEPEHSTDYRDDFGVYRVYEKKIKNYLTIFFFPFTVLWLECVLRLACGQTLLTFNMIFVVLFSLSFSAVLTVICTFFGEKFNRAIVNIIVTALTVWYCLQTVHFNLNGNFLLFSSYTPMEQSLNQINAIMEVMSDKVFYLLVAFVPLVLNLFVGKYMFPFRRIRIPAKICLLLVAVLMYFTAITAISFNKNSGNPTGNYATYHYGTNNNIQENFGVLAMGLKDFL